MSESSARKPTKRKKARQRKKPDLGGETRKRAARLWGRLLRMEQNRNEIRGEIARLKAQLSDARDRLVETNQEISKLSGSVDEMSLWVGVELAELVVQDEALQREIQEEYDRETKLAR